MIRKTTRRKTLFKGRKYGLACRIEKLGHCKYIPRFLSMLARPSFRLQRSCSTASMTLVPYFSLFTEREQDATLNKSPQNSAYFNSPKNLPVALDFFPNYQQHLLLK